MSKKTKLTPLEVVERYYNKYLEYEKAFNNNPFDEKSLDKEFHSLINSDIDIESDEALNKMLDVVIEKPQKRADVNTSAIRFLMCADFYFLVSEEPLPEKMQKDYENLEVLKDSYKPYYSVEGGEFVKNEDKKMDDNTKEFLKNIYRQEKAKK